MQVLNYLENSFDSFSTKIKVELILFPLVIFFILIYIFKYEVKNQVIEQNKSYSLENIKMEKQIVDILKDIESFLKSNNIETINISNYEKEIELKISSDIRNKIRLLNFLEAYNNFSKIVYLQSSKKILTVKLSFENLYVKKVLMLENRILKLDNKNMKELYLEAIVGNRVLINKKWLKIGDKISQFRLLKIEDNKAFFNRKSQTIIVRMYKNE
jgi:hypothetical protein